MQQADRRTGFAEERRRMEAAVRDVRPSHRHRQISWISQQSTSTPISYFCIVQADPFPRTIVLLCVCLCVCVSAVCLAYSGGGPPKGIER